MSLNGGHMGLGFTIKAEDLASGVLSSFEGRVAGLDQRLETSGRHIAESFGRIGTAAISLAAGFAPLGAAFATASLAGDFVQGLAAVEAATHASASQMRDFHDAALKAGIDTAFSPAEAVQGLISLATAGQTAEQSMQTLRPSLDLAAASLGQLNVEQAAEAIVGTLNSYAFGAEKAIEITDKLVQTTVLTSFQARDFAVGLARAAEAGAMYGQSLDDVLIGMGLLRNRNIMADVASTALRNAMIRVNSDVRSQNVLLQAGVSLRDQYTGQLRSILDVISDFSAATDGMDPLSRNAKVKEIFGEEGMPAFSAIMNATYVAMERGASVTYKGANAVAALRRELQHASGTADAFVKTYGANFRGQLVLLRGSLHGLGDVVGEALGEALLPVIKGVTSALNGGLATLMAMPMAVKKFAAEMFLGASALGAFAAGAYAVKQAMTLMRFGVLLARASLVSLLASFGAAAAAYLAAVGTVTVALGSLYAAYRSNFGAMTQLNSGATGQGMLLFWQGLRQVMDTGALQGDVLTNLNQRGVGPLKRLVVGAYQAFHALESIWDGVRAGFADMGEALSPFLLVMDASLQHLKTSITRFLGLFAQGTATTPMKGFIALGRAVGMAFSIIAATASLAVTAVAWALDSALNLFAVLSMKPEGAVEFWHAWSTTAIRLGGQVQNFFASWWAQSPLHTLCHHIAVGLPAAAQRGVQKMLAVFQGLLDNLRGLLDPMARTMQGAFSFSPIRRLAADFGLSGLPPAEPTSKASAATQVAVNDARPRFAQAFPASVEVRERATWRWDTDLTNSSPARRSPREPISVAVQIDGETVARAIARASRENAARSFTPLASF